MNGELAQAVALVAHCRAGLSAQQPLAMNLSHSTFKFVGNLDFEREIPRLLRAPAYESVGTEPAEWYEYLVGSGARSVSLVVERVGGRLADHVAVAFAGGGGWGIAVVHKDRKSLWRARWTTGKSRAPDDRIWSVLYREFGAGALPGGRKSVGSASKRLARVLADAAAFARDANLDFWLGWFDSAQEKLRVDEPTFEYHPDMLPPFIYTDDARRLLSACERAWVFGGMGSWNDLGFVEADLQRRYDTITLELYDAVLDGITAATNQDFTLLDR